MQCFYSSHQSHLNMTFPLNRINSSRYQTASNTHTTDMQTRKMSGPRLFISNKRMQLYQTLRQHNTYYDFKLKGIETHTYSCTDSPYTKRLYTRLYRDFAHVMYTYILSADAPSTDEKDIHTEAENVCKMAFCKCN